MRSTIAIVSCILSRARPMSSICVVAPGPGSFALTAISTFLTSKERLRSRLLSLGTYASAPRASTSSARLLSVYPLTTMIAGFSFQESVSRSRSRAFESIVTRS